jgi:hypothetical protein
VVGPKNHGHEITHTFILRISIVAKEALSSSQIEGTQSSFSDLLLFENDAEIHAILLRGGRGANRTLGEFRRSQNWGALAPAMCFCSASARAIDGVSRQGRAFSPQRETSFPFWSKRD